MIAVRRSMHSLRQDVMVSCSIKMGSVKMNAESDIDDSVLASIRTKPQSVHGDSFLLEFAESNRVERLLLCPKDFIESGRLSSISVDASSFHLNDLLSLSARTNVSTA